MAKSRSRVASMQAQQPSAARVRVVSRRRAGRKARPAAAARTASTQRGRMYLEPGARGLVAAAALRTAHWPAPGAP